MLFQRYGSISQSAFVLLLVCIWRRRFGTRPPDFLDPCVSYSHFQSVQAWLRCKDPNRRSSGEETMLSFLVENCRIEPRVINQTRTRQECLNTTRKRSGGPLLHKDAGFRGCYLNLARRRRLGEKAGSVGILPDSGRGERLVIHTHYLTEQLRWTQVDILYKTTITVS